MGAAQRARALFYIALSVVATAIVTVGFGWDLGETLLGAAAGAVVWGALAFIEVREQIPRSGYLPDAPAGVEFEPAFPPGRLRLVWVVPLCVLLAWLADRWDLGGAFVPGQFAGQAIASLAGVLLVGRWERRHSRRVLSHGEGLEVELFSCR